MVLTAVLLLQDILGDTSNAKVQTRCPKKKRIFLGSTKVHFPYALIGFLA
jgi:hypothetical protein